MAEHCIIGGNGVKLHVVEHGNPAGHSLLFIHGATGSHLNWQKQFGSKCLTDRFRLVAMDLRGHGLSDKPDSAAYGDSRLWADDVHAVITRLALDRPIICASSYAGLVVCDYLRFYGAAALAGLNLAGATSKWGVPAQAVLSKELQALLPISSSNDVDENVGATQQLVRLATYRQALLPAFVSAFGTGMLVPPRARRGMFSRTVDNDDLLRALRLPVLISHGAEDALALLLAAQQHKELIPQAVLSVYPNVGHLPFLERWGRFNRELRRFALECTLGG